MDMTLTSTPKSKRRYLTLFMIFVTVVICYVDRANLAVASAHIQQEFGISKAQMAIFFPPLPGPTPCVRSPAAGSWIASAPG